MLFAITLASTFASTPTSAQEVHRGGSLTVALRLTVASLDPLFGNAPGTDRKIYNLFAENLLMQDDAGKFHPVLAEKWDIQKDGLAIVFHLRHEVKFQDGTPFNAEAVKFNIDRLLDPKVNAPSKQYVADLKSVDVIDPYTVRVNLKRKSGVILAMLAVEPGSMLSPTAIKAKGPDFARSPVGTGPFKITSWSGNQIVAQRNPDYWRKDEQGRRLPYLDHVTIKIVPNSAIRIIELKSGNSQLADYLDAKDFAQITGNPALKLESGTTAVDQLLAFNVTAPPFDNIELRKAVAMAIDRKALAKVITRGAGTPLSGLEPPSTWLYDKNIKGHEFNIAEARRHYELSGYHGTLTLSVIQRDPDTQVAQLIQSMLKNAGIKIKLEMMERQAWLAKVLPHKYEFGLLQLGILRPDPDVTYSDLFGRSAARNYSGVDTKVKLAPLVAEARSESDTSTRRAIYTKLQQAVIDDFLVSPLFWQPIKEGASRKLQGFRREASTSWFYDRIWLQP
jgi:peptide/nickel transport system substrate-binding protein